MSQEKRHRGDAVTAWSPMPRPALFYMGAMMLLYTVVVVHTPMAILAHAGHDDGLFITLGRHLANGNWLGPFTQFTLMKGPGYPAFLAINNWLGIPVTLAHAIFHCAAVTFFVLISNRFLRSVVLSGLLFTLLLWHPIAFQILRIIRDQIYFDQLLFLLAALAGALFGARNAPERALFATLGGGALGWLWLTREEGVWILPAGAILLIAAAIRFYRRSRLDALAGILLLVIGVFGLTQLAFRTINWWVYGKFVGVDFKEANFQRALRALDSVRSGGTKWYVSMTRGAMQRVYSVSPTFASTASYFAGPGRAWEGPGCAKHPSTCGEIASGYFMWALRDAAAYNGQFSSPAKASAFFGRIADEVEAACQTETLQCVAQPIAEMPPVTWHQFIDGLAKNFPKALSVLLWPELSREGFSSSGSGAGLAEALRFLNYPLHTSPDPAPNSIRRYTISGWYYRSGADWVVMSVVRTDGSAVNAEIKRRASPDIVANFNDGLASLQRYTINVDCDDRCLLQVQTSDGLRVERRFAELANAPLGIAIGSGTFYVDRAEPGGGDQYKRTPADEAAGRLRLAVFELYSYALTPVLMLGLLAFFASTFLYWKSAVGNTCYLMALVAWLLVVARVGLLLLITATSFTALNPLYMAPAYFMMVSASVFSLASWLQLSGRFSYLS